jgi:hypothetical protein
MKQPNNFEKMNDYEHYNNIFHYRYGGTYAIRKAIEENDLESDRYIAFLKSLEGEVFENIIYEKLIQYAQTDDEITSFVLKGPHIYKNYYHRHGYSYNTKNQITFNSRGANLNELDALFFTKDTLYFIEMSITKSLRSLKNRLRKKKALLSITFPTYKVKSIIISYSIHNHSGRNLPDYCGLWKTDMIDMNLDFVKKIIDKNYLPDKFVAKRGEKMIGINQLYAKSFDYINSLIDITDKLYENPKIRIHYDRINEEEMQHFKAFYSRIYLGYLPIWKFKKMIKTELFIPTSKIMVAIYQNDIGKREIYYLYHHKLGNGQIHINEDLSIEEEIVDSKKMTNQELFHFARKKDLLELNEYDIKKAQIFIDNENKIFKK